MPHDTEGFPDAGTNHVLFNATEPQAVAYIFGNGGVEDGRLLEDESHAPAKKQTGLLVPAGIMPVKEDLS